MADGSGSDWFDKEPGLPTENDPPVLYSLQHALQDFAIVYVAATALFVLLVVTGLSDWLLGWADSYPRLKIGGLFLYAILLAMGFGMAILRRWMQLTRVARRQQEIRTELAEKAEALEQSNRELERFAYAASHDLREPLRMVHSYLGLLERQLDPETLDDEAQHFLSEARNASQRMDRMVRGILEYARLDPDAETSEPTDADAALSDAVQNLRMRLEARDIEIDREPLPPVLARRDELSVVFQNLIQNALVHGGPELDRIRFRGSVEDGMAVVRVGDDGRGFGSVHHEEVFDLFRQGEGSSTNAGAGMGLALCRRIVERHDGSIEARPAEGEGATFAVRLPAAGPGSPTGTQPHRSLGSGGSASVA